ncbi:MAG: DsrE family protein [Sterolibacteriaceae bacterium MAG5]|nr:DsrE family protein [Candidatus Nitricoxidireducens bremensis]
MSPVARLRLLLSVIALGASAAYGAGPERVVLQVSDADPKVWNQAVNVANNIRKELGKDNVQVEIVAFGQGIGMLRADAEIATRVEDAAAGGVAVMACANSMRNYKIDKDDLTKHVGIVPAGVVEIMKRQREGWLYLRP